MATYSFFSSLYSISIKNEVIWGPVLDIDSSFLTTSKTYEALELEFNNMKQTSPECLLGYPIAWTVICHTQTIIWPGLQRPKKARMWMLTWLFYLWCKWYDFQVVLHLWAPNLPNHGSEFGLKIWMELPAAFRRPKFKDSRPHKLCHVSYCEKQ